MESAKGKQDDFNWSLAAQSTLVMAEMVGAVAHAIRSHSVD